MLCDKINKLTYPLDDPLEYAILVEVGDKALSSKNPCSVSSFVSKDRFPTNKETEITTQEYFRQLLTIFI